MEGSQDYGKRYVDFQDTLREKISLLFIRHVQPRSVLHIIPSISEKVLTVADRQYIRSVSESRGEIYASQVLLECMSVYENWFHCVVKLLEHHEVKLPHIASLMKSIYEQVYDTFYSQSPSPVDQAQNQAADPMTKQLGPSKQDSQPNNGGDCKPDIKCQKNSKSTVNFLFTHHVNLDQFLRTLSCISSDQKIHTDKDMVENIAKVSGDDVAKKVLVDCIIAHKNWFSCMLKAFTHPNMNLKPLADILQMIHDRQDSEGNQTPDNPINATRDQTQAENDIWKPGDAEKEDPLCTMTFATDSAVTPNATTTTPKAGDMSAASFQYRLKKEIGHTFAAFVDIRKFLYIIPQINTEVLTVINVLEIQAVSRTKGKMSAAYHLLDCIVRYKDWFSLLLQVLRHAEMKLSHVADQLQAIQDDTLKKFQEQTKNSASPGAVPSTSDNLLKPSEYDVNVLKTKNEKEEDSSSLMFQQKLKADIALHFAHHVRPMSVLHLFSLINRDVLTLADVERIRLTKSYEGDTRAAFQLLDCLVVYKDWFPCLLKVLRHNDVKLHHVAAKFEEIYERSQNRYEASDDRAESLEEEKYDASETIKDGKSSPLPPASEKVTKHGPEYDFTYLETSKAMKTLPGWHGRIPEHMVEDKLQKLTASDGHYLLWHWERKKRPAICVTYKEKIKTFVVHKQIGPKNKPTMYFIDRNERHDADLLNLIEFHLRTGLPDGTKREDRILFLEPLLSMD